jgi:RHS repeat-associated protein
MGQKLSKTVKTGATINYIQDYLGGIEYNSPGGTSRKIEAIYHSEGRYYNTSATSTPSFRNEYTIKDHLGDARISFTDKNSNGKIDVDNTANNEILQENHYYAFGMAHEGPWLINDASKDNLYTYNGKEYNADHGLKWSDYGARWYDASIGRWSVVDPMADEEEDWTPYRYGFNNPITNIDVMGMSEDNIQIADSYSDDFQKKKRVPGEETERYFDTATNTVYIGYTVMNKENTNIYTSGYYPDGVSSGIGCGGPGEPPCPTNGKSLWESWKYAWGSMVYIITETGSKIDDEFTDGQIKKGNYIYASIPLILNRVKVPKVTGWVQKKIFNGLEKLAQDRIKTAIAKGIVGPTAENGIIELTASEFNNLTTHKY